MIENMAQFGEKGIEIKGITIHNTGNDLSAKENYEWMAKTSTSQGTHYLVDESETIQCMPLDWHVWHTGKGRDFGSMNTLAIEICRSQSNLETYLKAQKRAFSLISQLMVWFNLSLNDLYFHNDFNNRTYCPHRILDLYGSKKNFIKEVQNELFSYGRQ